MTMRDTLTVWSIVHVVLDQRSEEASAISEAGSLSNTPAFGLRDEIRTDPDDVSYIAVSIASRLGSAKGTYTYGGR